VIGSDYELAEAYLAECREHLVTVEPDLLAIERRGTTIDEEPANRVLRAMHSIESGAVFVVFVKIRDLAQSAAAILELLRTRELAPAPGTISVLLRAADKLRELCRSLAAIDQVDVTPVLADLAKLRAEQPATLKPRTAATVENTQLAIRHLRALLVEDDFVSRLVLQTFLCRYGECHIAVNGEEAVQAFRHALELGQSYDLICMDIMMPEMNGREAVRELRALEEAHGIPMTHGARIIMTTALDDIKEVFWCFRELCDAYLVKPIDLKKLLENLKSFRLIP